MLDGLGFVAIMVVQRRRDSGETLFGGAREE